MSKLSPIEVQMANDFFEAPAEAIKRRSPPDQLRYLAGKLREGDEQRESVALALDVIADEISPLCENCKTRPATLIRRGRMHENGHLWPRIALCEQCAESTHAL
jgi:hypothetical protein